MAGDDDQTIYGFQGADPNYFMKQEGERDDQEVSRRVPKAVHQEPIKILNQLQNLWHNKLTYIVKHITLITIEAILNSKR